ncbi:biogenesis of lysosome-related organelles complex 1 subunit 6 [Octodon degus]|uniref:Biogenesis of lysosome-related organelles complex 1 subunit 6 n=1 Tax=Octodon degus TaxID=10160 RepID=A0A6P6F6G3_OCTDE|nr:biogenesis of lysosome-related organelles complex 1 subunit 6 [Octodon degus]
MDTIRAELAVASSEAQASWACGLPWVASSQGLVPSASSREKGGPSRASWEVLPYGVLASYQGEEDPGDLRGVESGRGPKHGHRDAASTSNLADPAPRTSRRRRVRRLPLRHFRVQPALGSGRALAAEGSSFRVQTAPGCPFRGPSGRDMSAPGSPPPDGVPTGFPGEPTLGPRAASPDEGLVEDRMVEDRAVEQLAEGLLSHYLPDLQRSKQALQELTQNQVVLLDTLEQEISKFKECHSMLDINALFTEAKHYHSKLVNIRKDMLLLHEKTSKLKKRALKLQQKRQKEELEREQQREREIEREKQLTARPAPRP